MRIPVTKRKKALIVVDVQPSFLNERNEYVVGAISKLLTRVSYDCYIEATFHAEKESIWNTQQQWICPKGEKTQTVEALSLELKKRDVISIEKQTKSVFGGDKNLVEIFRLQGIEEAHIVGLETEDCILATAYATFDFGFITYAIEECCESAESEALHQHGLAILRAENMTNNSCVERTDFIEI